jgi:putative lipoic acid-binding regulatory protein
MISINVTGVDQVRAMLQRIGPARLDLGAGQRQVRPRVCVRESSGGDYQPVRRGGR